MEHNERRRLMTVPYDGHTDAEVCPLCAPADEAHCSHEAWEEYGGGSRKCTDCRQFLPNDQGTPEAPSTWRTVRLALEWARERGDISYPEFHAAMTEVMGTDDRSKW